MSNSDIESIIRTPEQPPISGDQLRELEISRQAALLGLTADKMVEFLQIREAHDELQRLEDTEGFRLSTKEALTNLAAEATRSVVHISLNVADTAFSLLPSTRKRGQK